jgi:DNA repair protein RadC
LLIFPTTNPWLAKAEAKRAARAASPPPTDGFRPSAVSEGDEIVGSGRAAEVGRLKRVSTSKALPFPFPRGEGEENSSWAAVFHCSKEPEMLLGKEVTQASDVELLTVLLGKRRTAETLLQKAGGSLFTLLFAMPREGTEMSCAQGASGYATDPTVKLQAARELAARAIAEDLGGRDCLSSPRAVRDLLKLKLAGLPHEVFVCLQLDAQHRVIAIEELFRGTLTQTSVYPREVVKAALRANAAAVIFAHNHPSGVAEPSHADEILTRSLKSALALVDVQVLDHFIVAGTRVMSFAEKGLL